MREQLLDSESLHAMRSEFHAQVSTAQAADADRLERLASIYRADVAWHGSHPLNDCSGAAAIIRRVWEPLLAAFPDLERRDEILIASEWRVSRGSLRPAVTLGGSATAGSAFRPPGASRRSDSVSSREYGREWSARPMSCLISSIS